ncbi:PadR family transcriptional regulator [Streptomyces sp. NPDC005925]|uniref:PadR family transcriptional regulator n=1 Tax=Streptomyces sp. NPDC005925 TaxID=3157172 RepID=UPI0033F66AFC
MSFPDRVTRPFLRVVDAFVQASADDHELHGWEIKKTANLSGAGTYKMLDRLEDAGWITGRWEERNPDPGKPPRRLYRLTPLGEPAARALLAERRPEALRPTSGPRHLPKPNPLSGFVVAFGRLGWRLPGGEA